jgi:hypothetical protein
MNKNLKISLIWTSGIIFLMSLLWFIAWFIAWFYYPNLWTRPGYLRPHTNIPLENDITEVLMRIDLPVPTYFHILRFRLQNNESIRILTLEHLRNQGAKANSFCTYDDFMKISGFHAVRLVYPEGNSATSFRKYIMLGSNVNSDNLYLYKTRKELCVVFPDGYIAVGYSQYGYYGYYDGQYGYDGDYFTEEVYKKHDDGRLELVALAKEFRPIPP